MRTLFEALLSDPRLENSIKKTLSLATVIRADNVRAYVEEHKTEFKDIVADFPMITPPFRVTWVEYCLTADAGIDPGALVDIGFLVLREDVAESSQTSARWEVSVFEFFRARGREITLFDGNPPQLFRILLEKDGVIARNEEGQLMFQSVPHPALTAQLEMDNLNPNSHTELLATILLTFSLMHCKNVTVEDVVPAFVGPKRHRNQHNKPKISYKVLKIRTVSRRHAEGEFVGGSSPSMHVRRGHFKQFTEDAPLFGRWSGMYWWEAEIVARASKSKVVKLYDVDQPGVESNGNLE